MEKPSEQNRFPFSVYSIRYEEAIPKWGRGKRWEPDTRAVTKYYFSLCSTEKAQMTPFTKQRQHCSRGIWPQHKGRSSRKCSKPSLVTLVDEQKTAQLHVSFKNSLALLLTPSYVHTYSEAAFLCIHYLSFPRNSTQYKANFPERQIHLLTITKELGKTESLLQR